MIHAHRGGIVDNQDALRDQVAISSRLQCFLIHDRFRKFAHLEQGRHAAHGFGMTQADITAGIEGFVECVAAVLRDTSSK